MGEFGFTLRIMFVGAISDITLYLWKLLAEL